MNYPYDELPFEEFFEKGTYDIPETFYWYGLNGDSTSKLIIEDIHYLQSINEFFLSDVDIDSSIHFYMGRCYTLRPKMAMKRVSKDVGYSLMLGHNIVQTTSDVDSKSGDGWHIFIHDKRENFTGKLRHRNLAEQYENYPLFLQRST